MARIYIPVKSIGLTLLEIPRPSVRARVAWMDHARIIACFAMIFNHTAAGVINGVADTGSAAWWMGNLFGSFSRWSLSVFLMISGALLLDTAKEEPLAVFYKKRASRILVPLLYWTVFYLLFSYFGRLVAYGDRLSAAALLNSVLYGFPYYHMWYLYMLIGLYFFTPFFKQIVRQSSQNELLVLCAALFVFASGGCAYMSSLHSQVVPALFTFVLYLPYYFAGRLAAGINYTPPSWLLWSVFGVSGVINGIGYYLTFNPGAAADCYFGSCLNIAIIPMSVSAMCLLKKLDFSFIHPSVIAWAAALSLGIYVIHPFFLDVLRFAGVTPEGFFPLLSIPQISAMVFVASLAASTLISKIPGLKRTIGL